MCEFTQQEVVRTTAVVVALVSIYLIYRQTSRKLCNSKDTVIIFTKYPAPDQPVKTRLIPALGKTGARLAQMVMTEHLLKRLSRVNERWPGVQFEVQYYGGNNNQVEYWLERKSQHLNGLVWKLQQGGHLGQRMKNAFKGQFSCQQEQVVIVGSDIPGVDSDIIEEALAALKDSSTDMVLGRAADGGYYLVGLNRHALNNLDVLFEGIDWGTDQVFEQQMKVAESLGMKLHVLSKTLADVDTPEDLSVFEQETGVTFQDLVKPTWSVVIPALNEIQNIEDTIKNVIQNCVDASQLEIVVADGGSTDGTWQKLHTIQHNSKVNLKVIRAKKGRGVQLSAGAEASSGYYLLFLHADTKLPQRYDQRAAHCLQVPGNAAGAFRFGLDILQDDAENLRKDCSSGFLWKMNFVQWWTNKRSYRFELPYGDQAIFLSRHTYKQVGGFPEWPLMEDFNLVEKLWTVGHVALVEGEPVLTAARRWQKHGAIKVTALNNFIVLAYRLGVSPFTLAQWYYGKPKLKEQ